MTFQQLWDDQLDIELASSDQSQLFTAARRKKAVNDAQDAFVRLTRCTPRYGTIPIVDETGEYGLVASLSDYLKLSGAPSIKIVDASSNVRYIQGKDDFPRRDPEWLDAVEPGWRAADPGTPIAWYLRDDSAVTYLGAYPAPDVATGETWTWIVPYVAQPTTMVNNDDEPFTINSVVAQLDEYHQALVHFAAAQLEPLRKNYSAVTRQQQIFAGYVAEYLQAERMDGNDQIRVQRNYLGESMRGARSLDPRRFP